MIDMSKYMTAVNKNSTNSLKGVVTASNQISKRRVEDGYLLRDILTNKNMISKFPDYTFPDIRVMDDGKIFVDPRKCVMTNMHEYRLKWFILNDKFEISHDHDYPFIQLPNKGYIMKVVIPSTSIERMEFSVDYVENIEHVNTLVNEVMNGIDEKKSEWEIPVVNFQVVPEVYDIIRDQPEFFRKYLQDLFD